VPTQPWIVLDRAQIPHQEQMMELARRGQEFVLRIGREELMSSRQHGSEDALADLACARLGPEPRARVLVGGLGMGFTLAAALRRLGPDARVVVAELVPAVVKWNRDVLGQVAGFPLNDARVTTHEGDVTELIRAESGAWDAILLDVDNGPTALTKSTNAGLYGAAGIGRAFQALRPGGVLGVWSAGDDAAFTRRLEQSGFSVTVEPVRARGARGGRRHVVWIATRPRGSPARRKR
jgi:spermidine synthase